MVEGSDMSFVVQDGLNSFFYDDHEGYPKLYYNVPVNLRWVTHFEPSKMMLSVSAQFPCIVFHMSYGTTVTWCFSQSTIRDQTYDRLINHTAYAV